MKKKRYSDEQIVMILREVEAGGKVGETCRKHGVSDATYYSWKAKYSGMGVSDLKRLKALEEENRRLKTMVADQALDIQALKAIISKNF